MSDSWPVKQTLQGLREQADQLIEMILRQAGLIEELKIEKLEKQIRDLNDRNNGLSQKVEELEKAAAPQAAPFRRREHQRVVQPKKPGRAQNHPGSYRPIPQHVEEEIRVPLCQCPECAEKVPCTRPIVQYLEEIPPVRPRVIKLVTEILALGVCRQNVHGLSSGPGPRA